jgi:hypothetical protein
MVDLFPSGASNSSSTAVNSDGSVIVGGADNARGFRWVNGTVTNFSLYPRAVNSDGSVAVGDSSSGAAARWTALDGVQTIDNLLTTAGAVHSGWTLMSARSVSADGTIIVGSGSINSQVRPWIARLPLPQISRLQVSPTTNIFASGSQGGPFSQQFNYILSATSGNVNYSISGVPNWLTLTPAGSISGSVSIGTTVTFTVNASANSLSPGTYGPTTITFTNTDSGQGTTTVTATLTVNAPGVPPTVTSIAPTGGTTAGGTAVTITGTNLTGATSVTIGGTAATNVAVVNATTVTAVTPAHVAGTVDVVVTTPDGKGTGTGLYTYVTSPTVTSIAPTSGPTQGGTSVTITGTNFTGATAVTIGGAAATSVMVVNNTTITAITPGGTAGTASVAVTTPGGTVSANLYTYVTPPPPPTVTLSNIFRDFRAANDLGITAGDEFQFGGEVAGGSATVSIQGIFTSNSQAGSFNTSVINCDPPTTDANFCARSAGFSSARQNGTWQAKFINNNGGASTTVNLPSVANIPSTPVPFPTNVTISTDSQGKPTISWTAPPGTINDFRVNVYDKSQHTLGGAAVQIESKTIPPSQTGYTPTVALAPGGNYAIGLQVIQSRDGGPLPANSSNSDILSRSSSYFDFTPPNGGSPPSIHLPTVAPNGVYSFQVGGVGPNSVTFIDPAIAIGYTYAIGPTDPNFASVILPNVGGGQFTVSFPQNGTSVAVAADTQFFFPSGGVSTFTVTGINPSAALDPSNGGAFVTGLTFVSAGSFTGTMTPIETGNTLFAATLPASRSVQVGATALGTGPVFCSLRRLA